MLVILVNFVSALNANFLKGVDPVLFYKNFHGLIDFVLAFLIFYGLAKFTFAKKFEGSENFIIAGISIALSFGIILWMNQTKTTLLNLGPFALFVVFVVLFWVLAKGLESIVHSFVVALCLAYAILYFIAVKIFGAITLLEVYAYDYIDVFEVAFWICLIFVVISFLFQSKKGKEVRVSV